VLCQVRQAHEFGPQPVSSAELEALANVARWSGSTGNSQPWRFVLVRREETLRSIGRESLPQTSALLSAPAAIAISMPIQPGSSISLAYDEGRAAERILIGAHLLGLGAAIAWLLPDSRAAAAALLGLPPERTLRTVVAVGHPTQASTMRTAARLPRHELILSEPPAP
jgi:nitroreductase